MINKKINKIKQNQGQIAIIVLLASAILLSLGLSASKKAITDTKVDINEELLKEAFNAAESGINNYINTTNVNYDAGDGNNAVITKKDIGGGESITLSSEGLVLANTNQLFWLVNHEDDGSIGNNYYSGNITLTADNNFNGALKVDYFYIQAGGAYKVSRFGCNYGGSNTVVGFSSDTTNCSNLTLTGSSLLLIVTPMGSATSLSISGSSPFPIQGEQLTAVGTANNGVKTQIKTRNIYQIPSFFTEAITAKNIIQ